MLQDPLVAEIQVTPMSTDLVEMNTVEMTQVVMDTFFLSEVQGVPTGTLWMRDPENQEQSFHLSRQNSLPGKLRPYIQM